MSPEALLTATAADGVTLRLSPAGGVMMAGSDAALCRWRSVLRQNKAGILKALTVNAGDPGNASRSWRIRFANHDLLEVYCSPPASHAEILAHYPEAVAVDSIRGGHRAAPAT